jgi:pimeloyl-ACP methyl ester carboxylesterase
MHASFARIRSWTLVAIAPFALFLVHEASAADRIEIAGQGTDVVLIPGLASSGEAMQPVAEYLSRCHRTHTLTLAGFAGQPAGESTALASRVDSIDRYISTLEPHRAVVVGHSLGGVLALKLAIDHPDHVDRLVILDALPYLPAAFAAGATVESVKAQAEQTRQLILSQSAESFRASQERALAMMTNHSERVPTLVEWSLASDRRALADAYYELFTTDLRNDIAKIKAPTLVLVPWDVSQPQDTATTLDTYRKQYAPLASAQVKLIKGSRHFLMFDQPIATNWAIDEFLGKCPTHAAQ